MGDGLAHGFGRDMAEVDQHTDPVHLPDDGPAEGGEAAMLWVVGGAVGKVVVQAVRERHVTRAQRMKLPKGGW